MTVNFYRASACNACRARYCYGISVCPMPVLYLNEWTYRPTFWQSGRGIIRVFFESHRRYNTSRGSPQWGRNIGLHGGGIFFGIIAYLGTVRDRPVWDTNRTSYASAAAAAFLNSMWKNHCYDDRPLLPSRRRRRRSFHGHFRRQPGSAGTRMSPFSLDTCQLNGSKLFRQPPKTLLVSIFTWKFFQQLLWSVALKDTHF